MCLAVTNNSVIDLSHTTKCAPGQLLSHFSIKSTTSFIVLGNSLIVRCSSFDFGTSLSRSS